MEKGPSANVEGLFSLMMTSTTQECAVEVVRAESARFRHPLLMIHGLWTGGWVWHGFAGYLGHRGWDSWLPSMSGTSPERRHDCLLELARELPAPPILVTHDAGYATAIALAEKTGARAIVVIAPLLSRRDGGALALLGGLSFWPARLGAHRVSPPRGAAALVLLRGAGEHVIDRLVPDSGEVFRAVLSGAGGAQDPARRPGLLICGAGDPVTPSAAGERFAITHGWAFDLHGSAGHFPMLEAGFESLADRVHRWLVRALGEDLLVLLDDEDDAE